MTFNAFFRLLAQMAATVEAAHIASDLAKVESPIGQAWLDEESTVSECVLCGVRDESLGLDELLDDPAEHLESCPWRRSRELTSTIRALIEEESPHEPSAMA